jgi:hypothetical protein
VVERIRGSRLVRKSAHELVADDIPVGDGKSILIVESDDMIQSIARLMRKETYDG